MKKSVKKKVAKRVSAKKKVPKSPAVREKVAKVMHEFKEGELPMGKSKKKVKSRKQAIAIALSEARKARK